MAGEERSESTAQGLQEVQRVKHRKGCSRKMKVKSLSQGGGRSCDCGARWVCL